MAVKLEKLIFSWIIGSRIQGNYHLKVARALLRLPSVAIRRELQAVRMLSRLCTDTRNPRSPHSTIAFRKSARYKAIADICMQTFPSLVHLPTVRDVSAHGKNRAQAILEKHFKEAQEAGVRKIPCGRTTSLAPSLQSALLSRKAQHMSVLWYLSKLVPTPGLRTYLARTKKLLELDKWSSRQERDASQIFEQMAGLRDGLPLPPIREALPHKSNIWH